jgi:hypothetical protein
MNSSESTIFIILERDSYERDAIFLQKLIQSLSQPNRTMVWYNPSGVGTSQMISSHPSINKLPKLFRYPIKLLLLVIKNPHLLINYLSIDSYRESTIEGRCANLKKFIKQFPTGSHIVLLGRSAGARVATKITHDSEIQKLGMLQNIIAIGYPFKHPDHDPEPDRYQHLETITIPTLIIQGTHDEYGGATIREHYSLSPAVSLSFVDTNHDFQITQHQFDSVVTTIENFLHK